MAEGKKGRSWTRREVIGTGAALTAAAALPGCALEMKTATPGVEPIPALSKIAWGSCIHQDRPAPILETIRAAEPDLMLFLGDNVYGDDKPDNQGLNILAEAYAKQKARPEFQALRAEVPVMATWDDHDYGLNDAGGEFPYKDKAQKMFADFWDLPADDPRRTRPGVYSSKIFGPKGKRVQIILLDARYFRSELERNPDGAAKRYADSEDENKTLLGEVQWAWFAEQLKQPADLRLIASSIQVIADGHGWEKWGNIQPERDRFFETVKASGAKGVVLLSGDRHSAALYKLDRGAEYPLYEGTSSSLNLAFLEGREIIEEGPHRLTEMYTGENVGMVGIDWAARTVSLTIHAEAGAVVEQTVIAFDEIAAG